MISRNVDFSHVGTSEEQRGESDVADFGLNCGCFQSCTALEKGVSGFGYCVRNGE